MTDGIDGGKRIIVALDVSNADTARGFAIELAPYVGAFKIGLELITTQQAGDVVRAIHKEGGSTFWDGKVHDIPATAAAAVREATRQRVAMFNVHCLGGFAMMQAAVAARDEICDEMAIVRPPGLGVTILTSHDHQALIDIGLVQFVDECEDKVDIENYHKNGLVVRLARLAQDAGLDGVIASPQEIVPIRQACGGDFLIVTPGIRPAGSDADDQKRTDTPASAIESGADYLVIGRPITKADDPVKAAVGIGEEVTAALVAKEGGG